MTRLKLAIFDVDGTLADSQGHIRIAMEGAFDLAGLPVPSDVLSIVGLSLPQAMRHLVPDASEAQIETLVDGYKATYSAHRAGTAPVPLYPGALEAIKQLHARDDVLLGIATGKSQKGLRHLLAAHGLDRYFVTTQVADHHPSKPHPSMVLTALAETGVEACDAVMIGDTSFDMQMAQAARVAGVGVSWGYHGVANLTPARHVLHDFAELIPALDQIWRNP